MSLFNKKLLRNCAFCGGMPKLTRCGDQKEYVVYLCSECFETPVQFDEACLCEFGARITWNRRTEEAEHVIKTYNRLQASMTKFTSSEGTMC